MHNQTPTEQWNKKPRLANKVKATDIFKSNPKKPGVQKERKALGIMQNLKFHGDETIPKKTCSRRKRVDKQLSQSRAQHCLTETEDPKEQEALQSFSSECLHGCSQNTTVGELTAFKPPFYSTPCGKKNAELKDITRPNCCSRKLIPDPSPNVFRWCEDVFDVLPAVHQCVRSTADEKQPSALKICDPQSHDVDSIQVSFEKLVFEQSPPDVADYNIHADGSGDKLVDKSLSVLACDTPTHNGEYIMPYSRTNT